MKVLLICLIVVDLLLSIVNFSQNNIQAGLGWFAAFCANISVLLYRIKLEK